MNASREDNLNWLQWIGRILSTGGYVLLTEKRKMQIGMCPACGDEKERGHACNSY